MIGQGAHRPGAPLHQGHAGGSEAPLVNAAELAGGGRQQGHRADAPDHTTGAGLGGGEEQALHGVAEIELAGFRPSRALEVHHRQDRAGNQVPVGRKLEGHHRLDVEVGPLDVLLDADTTVVVELERHADQRGHWVGQLLGEAGLLGAEPLRWVLPFAAFSGRARGLGDHGLVGLNRRNALAAGRDGGGSRR